MAIRYQSKYLEYVCSMYPCLHALNVLFKKRITIENKNVTKIQAMDVNQSEVLNDAQHYI